MYTYMFASANERKERKAFMKTIREVQSICPQCRRIITAEYAEEGGKVYFRKICPEHGETRVLVSESVSDYAAWADRPVTNIAPKQAQTEGHRDNCPLDCGTCSEHLQTACCVLIDVTNRCNQHCPYCFAAAGEAEEERGRGAENGADEKCSGAAAREPDLEEIEKKYDRLIELGEEWPFNIQLSGGEPTVRDDLPEIISMGRDKGFKYIQINSNGRRLGEEEGYAQKLKDAGASVIFMQFDGMNDRINMKLRNEPLLAVKQQAVENCRKAGLPVTLVPTVVRGVNLDDIGNLVGYMTDNTDVIKGIHFQPVSFFGRHPEQDDEGTAPYGDFAGRVTMFDVLHELEAQTGFAEYKDFCPISTGHPLCCFYSTYVKEPDGRIRCMLSEETKQSGAGCCDTTVGSSGCCSDADNTQDRCCGEPQDEEGPCCCGEGGGDSRVCGCNEADPLEIIKKDRNYVLNKWELPEQDSCCCGEPQNKEGCCGDKAEGEGCCSAEGNQPMDMDEFLRYYKTNTFTLTGMAFMDGSCLDAERLKRCRVQQLTDDGRLVPFCAYNSIYR